MNFKMTINGKPMTESNIRESIEQAVFKSAVAQMKDKIETVITPEEAAKITIDVQGNDIKSLKLNITGPEEIVSKIKKALS